MKKIYPASYFDVLTTGYSITQTKKTYEQDGFVYVWCGISKPRLGTSYVWIKQIDLWTPEIVTSALMGLNTNY